MVIHHTALVARQHGAAASNMEARDLSLPNNLLGLLQAVSNNLGQALSITSNEVGVLPSWDPKYNDNPLDLEVLAREKG